MQDPPMNYNICECCGTEFGNDDEMHSHEELRAKWIEGGAKWFFRSAPIGWNPWTQLFKANVSMGQLPYETAFSLYGSPLYEIKMSSLSSGLLTYDAASIGYEIPLAEAQLTFWGMEVPSKDATSTVYYGGPVPETQIISARATNVLAFAA
jgi:hypothetical protein